MSSLRVLYLFFSKGGSMLEINCGIPTYRVKSRKIFLCRRRRGKSQCKGRYAPFGNDFICTRCGKVITSIPENCRL